MFKRFGGWQGRFWRRGFLRQLNAALCKFRPDDAGAIVRATRREAAQIYDATPKPDPGRKGHMIVNMCSLVLAAYRVVRERTGDSSLAFRVAQQTMESNFRTPILWMLRVYLKLYRDPVARFSRMNFVKRGRKTYGTSMVFDQEQTSDGVDMLVRRCSFHQFFADHGVPGLTLAVCNWDRNWMDLLNDSGRPIRSERPSTISTGGDCCRFRFIRDDDKHDRPANDAVLVALAQQPATPGRV
jgi:hypothetical protein